MDVRIGISQSTQVIELELGQEVDGDSVRQQIDDALGNDDGVLWLTDRKGKQVGIPSSSVSFVELSAQRSRAPHRLRRLIGPGRRECDQAHHHRRQGRRGADHGGGRSGPAASRVR